MTKPRKHRFDQITGQLESHTKQKVIAWPRSVTAFKSRKEQFRAKLEFESILANRVADDWLPSQVTIAAQLAQTIIQHDRLNQQLEVEGFVLAGAPNPKFAILSQIHQKVV